MALYRMLLTVFIFIPVNVFSQTFIAPPLPTKPPSTTPAAPPLPGVTTPSTSPAAPPLPGAQTTSTVQTLAPPLPGVTQKSTTRVPIPGPFATGTSAPPLPGVTTTRATAPPLPGVTQSTTPAAPPTPPLPGAQTNPTARTLAPPLPGVTQNSTTRVPIPGPFATGTSAPPLPGVTTTRATAPPLPGVTQSTTPAAPPTPPLPGGHTNPTVRTLAPPLPGVSTASTTRFVPSGTPTPPPPMTNIQTQTITAAPPQGTSSTVPPPIPSSSAPPQTRPPATTTQPPATSAGPAEGSLRLVNGSKASEGRLEIYHSGQWGTICDDDFNAEEAAVACKQLGFTKPPFEVRGEAGYGAGKGSIWLDDVVCNGSESSIVNCRHTSFGGSNCGHYEDVGLNCDLGQQIRLVNGWKSSEGRVEVYHNGKWGTVCDDGWGAPEAAVLCKTLGYNTGSVSPTAATNAKYGQGSGQIWLDDFNCVGTESSIFACRHATWGRENCNHNEDAGVDCTPGSSGNATEVRLFDGWKPSEGRIEVYHNGQRGTVCDDNFGAREAAIVCKMLGYNGTTPVPKPGAFYGSGTSRIVLDDLDCQGTEATIFQCQHSTYGTSDCQHSEDVGVDCDPGSTANTLNATDIRLVGGSRSSEGRLELHHNGEWGTVCASNWDTREAMVVCRMLGYQAHLAGARIGAYYGSGAGRIWFDEVECQGNETNLLDCQHKVGSSCRHSADVGLDCNPSLDGNATTIRLVNGNRSSAGRVEVYHNGQWGTVCDHNFGVAEATVICQMLGFPGPVYGARSSAYFGPGKGSIWLDYVDCLGNETSVFACQHKFWGQNSCSHSRDAGVDCEPRLEGNASTVRLVNGWKKSEGRIEVFHNGRWGTVCDDNFSTDEATVFCKMIGYHGTSPIARPRAYYGQGNEPTWLDDVNCQGGEVNFFECSHPTWGQENCNHGEDVGVDCDPSSTGQTVNVSDFRLVDGSRPTQGRLEIFHNGQWGTVCMTNWDAQDAEVVCRMLNMSSSNRTAAARPNAYFGEGNGSVWIDNLNCNGNEANVLDCSHSAWGRRSCDHRNDVGVDCAPGSDGNSSTIRLVNGARPSQGRLEVYHNGEWGTVCDDNFELVDAQVACKTLGYGGNWSIFDFGLFGEGTGRIWLDEVDCNANDPDLFYCGHNGWGRTDCAHGEDIGIDCKPELDGNRTTIRLVNGTKKSNGRLEVLHNGQWGTICNHQWDDADTAIACKTLGFKGAFFTQAGNKYGIGNGTIWLDDFNCQGSEPNLFACQHSSWGHPACDHQHEVGIDCDPELRIRLADGPDKNSGRVEVQVNGTWGTVCDDSFDQREANVICRSLGNRRGGTVASHSVFGPGKGTIWFDDLGCKGTEFTIFQCSNRGLGVNNCGHNEDVGVRCLAGCLVNSDCDNNGTCLADHTCQCASGWIGKYCDVYVGPSGDCHLPDACPIHSRCVPGNASHIQCVCDSGYEERNLHCEDIDECHRGHACPSTSVCENTEGGYTCRCPPGYTHRGSRCADIDECSGNHACPPFTVCENAQGSYRCRCANGYQQDGLFCTDVDECKSNLCPPGTQCTNTPGSFTCACRDGYTLSGFRCVDVDECRDPLKCPQQHANCFNTPGNFSCSCVRGYSRHGNSCDDNNECAGTSFSCPAHSHCVNIPGDYRCDCDSGYVEQNFLCRPRP